MARPADGRSDFIGRALDADLTGDTVHVSLHTHAPPVWRSPARNLAASAAYALSRSRLLIGAAGYEDGDDLPECWPDAHTNAGWAGGPGRAEDQAWFARPH
jgi:hypothetical protein